MNPHKPADINNFFAIYDVDVISRTGFVRVTLTIKQPPYYCEFGEGNDFIEASSKAIEKMTEFHGDVFRAMKAEEK